MTDSRSLPWRLTRCAISVAWLLVATRAGAADAQPLSANQRLARDVYRELVELDTVTATGDTAKAAQAMAARLRAGGFPEGDVHVFTPGTRKGNLVARLRGTGARRPILLVAHLDVVDARREDWTTDPFKLVEKDGWFYGRGTADDKAMAAAFVSNLVRYRREGYLPERDIVVALETDEEIGDRDGLGMQWLLKHHRDLIDAELALNEGGSVAHLKAKPVMIGLQTAEKVLVNFVLEVKSRGGHSSVPVKENAIYQLAAGLGRLSQLEFPVRLNSTTRAWLEKAAGTQEPAVAADMRAVASREDPAAAARLSATPFLAAQLRTTCVATQLEGGHAPNALPQVARATVNCRVLPGESIEDVRNTLMRVLADDRIAVTILSQASASPPSPIDLALVQTIERIAADFWPAVPVVPLMSASGTDGRFLRTAGIPTYGHSGFRGDLDDIRAHGRDERMSVRAFDDGTEYLYRLVKALAGTGTRADRSE